MSTIVFKNDLSMMKENNSDIGQAISKITFLETPLPKK